MKYLIALLLAIPLWSQPNNVIRLRFSDPTGLSCATATAPAFLFNGTIYTCQSGSYAAISGGSGCTLGGVANGSVVYNNAGACAAATTANDTNVTIGISGGIVTAGWTGVLSPTRGGLGSNFSACSGIPLFVAGNVVCNATTGTFGNVVGSVSPTFTGTVVVSNLTMGGTVFNPVHGTTASLPATCTIGQVWFSTDATAGQNWYFCTATNTWTQQLNSGGGGGGTVTVVGGGSLTNTALVTGGGTTTLQTPSATATMDTSGNISTPGKLTTGSGSGAAGSWQCLQGTASTVSSNAFGWTCPTTMTTSLLLMPPNASPTADNLMVFPAPTTNVSQWAWLALATGVKTFLGTPSSANLASAITDETGSGALVFGTSPTLTTPNLGTPSAINLTNATALPAAQVPAVLTTVTGTSRSIANNAEIIICTATTCTVTPPATGSTVAGMQFCAQGDDNVASAITIAAVASVQYETTARTSYKTANTALVSTGVVKDQICMVAKDATHWNVFSVTGTWN